MTPFFQYTLPITNYEVKSEEQCYKYENWFKNCFINERQIVIVDRYAANKEGLLSLESCYLPNIEKGAEIDIYVSETAAESIENIKKFMNNNPGWKITFYFSDLHEEHDRFILLKSMQIVIGKGICFMNGERKKTYKTFISMNNIDSNLKRIPHSYKTVSIN